jgi:hypothetical protein
MTKKKKKIELSDDDIDDLTSYADGQSRVRRRLNIGSDELTEAALDKNVEQCSACRWWFESGELVDDSGEPTGKCGDCRGNHD